MQNARSVLFDGAAHRSGLLTCKDGRHYTLDRCNSPDVMTVMVLELVFTTSSHFNKPLEK